MIKIKRSKLINPGDVHTKGIDKIFKMMGLILPYFKPFTLRGFSKYIKFWAAWENLGSFFSCCPKYLGILENS
jgi:hypothetical protein